MPDPSTTVEADTWSEWRTHVLAEIRRFGAAIDRLWEAVAKSEADGRKDRDEIRQDLAKAIEATREHTEALRSETEERLRTIETRCVGHRTETVGLSTRTMILWAVVGTVGVALTSAIASVAVQALTGGAR